MVDQAGAGKWKYSPRMIIRQQGVVGRRVGIRGSMACVLLLPVIDMLYSAIFLSTVANPCRFFRSWKSGFIFVCESFQFKKKCCVD